MEDGTGLRVAGDDRVRQDIGDQFGAPVNQRRPGAPRPAG